MSEMTSPLFPHSFYWKQATRFRPYLNEKSYTRVWISGGGESLGAIIEACLPYGLLAIGQVNWKRRKFRNHIGWPLGTENVMGDATIWLNTLNIKSKYRVLPERIQ